MLVVARFYGKRKGDCLGLTINSSRFTLSISENGRVGEKSLGFDVHGLAFVLSSLSVHCL